MYLNLYYQLFFYLHSCGTNCPHTSLFGYTIQRFFYFNSRVTDGRKDGRTDGWTDGQTDGQTDGWTDTPSYRDARSHLKILLHSQVAKSMEKFAWEIVPWEWQVKFSNSTPQQPFWMSVDQSVNSQENIISTLPALTYYLIHMFETISIDTPSTG